MANFSTLPKNLKINGKKLLLGFLYLFIVVSVAISGVFAKYVHKDENNRVVETPNFYFESDLLVENGKTYDLTPGTTSVSFYLRNYADVLRFSTDTIEYAVTSSGGTLTNGTGEIVGGDVNEVMVTLSGLQDGETYTVSANGNAGFNKTLTATFKVKLSQPMAYKSTEATNAYVLLTVWTEDLQGEVVITYPEGLLPDNTWEGMENVAVNSNRTLTISNLDKYSSLDFRFVKIAGYDSSSEFTVTVNGIEAVPKAS